MTPSQRIAAAIAAFNNQRFEQARGLVADLLEGEEANVDALNLAAACARALGQAGEAERCARRAIACAPDHAASWNNLGIMLQDQGRAAEAEAAYLRAVALQPAYADAHYHLGLLYQQGGAFAAAAEAHERALTLRPHHALNSANLGVVLERLGRFEEAERRFGDAVTLDPNDVDSLQRRASLLHRLGRLDEAAACFHAARSLRPQSAELWNNSAVLDASLKRHAAAEAGYRRALALRPGYPDAWHNLGLLYMQRRRFPESLAALGEYRALRPDDIEGLNSLANLYQHMGRDADAEAAYRRALVLRPAYAKTLNNLATLLQRQGRVAEAETVYLEAAAADPGYPEPRWNLGFLLLAQGRLDEGWPWMEARYDPALARPIARAPRLAFPQWRGESLAGKSIVVWPEQGFGDQIQFVRYLPLLKAAGARHVTLVCHDPLLPLLRTAPGADTVLGAGDVARLEAHDFWVFMLSLPMHFHTSLDNLPAALPYLAADPVRSARWQARLASVQAAGHAGAGLRVGQRVGLRVGLVWRGFAGHVNDTHRSLPGLEALAPLWSIPNVSFFGLQRGMDGEPAPGTTGAFALTELGPEIGDFGDTAAIVEALDLVICVDTAVAHVAGALGKPCWVLLPAVHPDWRWLVDRHDTPWYPKVLRLYRQQRAGEWEQVVREVTADLATLAGM
ncbi:tetratricopeptide repeat protein [Massilia sp.]|uniref:tetratricopeptide repeat protein n=1 Tax=Massilia sp. TaxID=1882437 RepID=UPI0028A7207C|nr:tetratricopeptide repeat protein [Massilia sp.]